MPERDANQLAADDLIAKITARIETARTLGERGIALSADEARELVALVGTLQQERDDNREQAEENFAAFIEERNKAVAAEAALAEARETVANLCTRPGTCLADTGGDTKEPA